MPMIWEPCPDCDEYWCNIHREHAHDCSCPGIEDMIEVYPDGPYDTPFVEKNNHLH